MSETNALSDREIEILQLVATGLTNREIAQSLTISPNTVKVHMRNIFEKIGVSSRTEATLYGIEHGIVDVPGANGDITKVQTVTVVQKIPWTFVAIIGLVLLVVIAFGWDLLFPQPITNAGLVNEMPERWQELAPLPEPRSSMAAAAYDGNIYAIAGEGPDGVSGGVFRYITGDDRWEVLSDKPTPVADVKGVLVGEKIYVPGGRLADDQPTDILEVYDPRRDTWEQKASLPIKVSGYALADFEGQIYLFGGWDGEKVLDTALRYDPQDDQWDEVTPMPTARAYAGAAEAGGKIYVIGGWDGEKALDVNESYSHSRDRVGENPWNDEKLFPKKGYGISIQSMAGILFVLGEDENSQVVLYQYISQNNDWSIIDNQLDLSFDRNMGVVNHEGMIYVMGGSNQAGEQSSRIIQYQAIYTISLPGITN